MQEITEIASYEHVVNEIMEDYKAAYASGNLHELASIDRIYRSTRSSAEDAGIDTSDMHRIASKAICSMVDMETDSAQRFGLIARTFPGGMVEVKYENGHMNPEAARLYIAALVRNVKSEIGMNKLCFVFSIFTHRSKDPDFFVLLLGEIISSMAGRKKEGSDAMYSRIIDSALYALAHMHDVSPDFKTKVIGKMHDLYDLASRCEGKVKIEQQRLTYVFDSPYREAAIEYFRRFYISGHRDNDFVSFYMKTGMSYSRDKMMDYIKKDLSVDNETDDEVVQYRALQMAALKVAMGDEDDYSQFFSGYQLRAEALKKTLAGIASGDYRQGAVKRFAIGAFEHIDQWWPNNRSEIIEAFENLPCGNEILREARSSRKSGRKLLEFDLDM